MNAGNRGLYARFAPILSLAFGCALIWAHLATAGTAFSIISGFFLAHAVVHVIVALASAGPASDYDELDIPRVGDAVRRAPVLIKAPAAEPWKPSGPDPRAKAKPAPAKAATPNPPAPKPAAPKTVAAKAKAAPVEEGVVQRCAAVRNDGSTCNYDARIRSKYCTAHQGYRPKKVAASPPKAKSPVRVAAPAPVKARKPAKEPKAEAAPASPATSEKPRCVSKTAKGAPCKNAPKGGSELCGIHAKQAARSVKA